MFGKLRIATAVAPICLCLLSPAQAMQIEFTIDNGNTGGSYYSLIHDGAMPSGGNWRYFAEGQTFLADLTEDLLTTAAYGPQTVAMANGHTFVIENLEIMLDGDYGVEETDGIVGELFYMILHAGDMVGGGIFTFTGQHYSQVFNSAGWDGDSYDVYMSGGDTPANQGIDLHITAHGPTEVPAPGTLALIAIGLLGIAVLRRQAGTAAAVRPM